MTHSWYYTKDRSERSGPVNTDTLRAMLENGTLGAEHLVWREGLSDWAPAASQPELRVQESPPLPEMDANIKQPPPLGVPPNLNGWLRFVGIMSIIMGMLYCASCVGILWGVLLIIGGVALLGAQTALRDIPAVPPTFIPFLHKLNTFFLVTGITYIIMLVGLAFALIFYGGVLIAALSSGGVF